MTDITDEVREAVKQNRDSRVILASAFDSIASGEHVDFDEVYEWWVSLVDSCMILTTALQAAEPNLYGVGCGCCPGCESPDDGTCITTFVQNARDGWNEAKRLRAENATLTAQVGRLTDALLQVAGNGVMPDGDASVRAWCTRTALAALEATQEVE